MTGHHDGQNSPETVADQPEQGDIAGDIACRLAGLPRRREGGKLHVSDPGHRLARPDGWVVAARWVLYERWLAEGVTAPRCETPGCGPGGNGRRVGWAKRRTQRAGGLPAAVPWFLDGNPDNLAAGNVIGVCASCAQRGFMAGRIARTPDGRFL